MSTMLNNKNLIFTLILTLNFACKPKGEDIRSEDFQVDYSNAIELPGSLSLVGNENTEHGMTLNVHTEFFEITQKVKFKQGSYFSLTVLPTKENLKKSICPVLPNAKTKINERNYIVSCEDFVPGLGYFVESRIDGEFSISGKAVRGFDYSVTRDLPSGSSGIVLESIGTTFDMDTLTVLPPLRSVVVQSSIYIPRTSIRTNETKSVAPGVVIHTNGYSTKGTRSHKIGKDPIFTTINGKEFGLIVGRHPSYDPLSGRYEHIRYMTMNYLNDIDTVRTTSYTRQANGDLSAKVRYFYVSRIKGKTEGAAGKEGLINFVANTLNSEKVEISIGYKLGGKSVMSDSIQIFQAQ